jgi:hypothetical protein
MLSGCGPDLAQLNSHQSLDIMGIALIDAHSGYAVGLRPGEGHAVLLREQNDAWQPDPNPPDVGGGESLRAVAIAGETLWVAGERADAAHGDATQQTGFVFARGKDGTWARTALGNPINALAFTSATEGWAVGNNGGIYHYHNGVWRQSANSMESNLYSVAFRSPTDGWATGGMGTFVHYDGTGWYHQEHFTHADFFAVALAPDQGWAVGTDGEIARLGADGNWFDVATPVLVTGRAIAIVAGNVWLVGDNGLAFERLASDNQWHHLSRPADVQLNAIAIAPNGTMLVGGNFPKSMLYAWQAGDWHLIPTGLP